MSTAPYFLALTTSGGAQGLTEPGLLPGGATPHGVLENVLGSAVPAFIVTALITVPAFIVTALISGEAGVRDLARRSFRWRVPLRCYLISLLAPLLILLIAITILYRLAAKRYRVKEHADNKWISGRWGETAKRRGVTSSDFLGAIVRDPPAQARITLSGIDGREVGSSERLPATPAYGVTIAVIAPLQLLGLRRGPAGLQAAPRQDVQLRTTAPKARE